MLFQIDHRSSRLAALLSELFCPLSLPLVLALISLQQLQYDSLIHLLPFIVVIAINSISLAIGIGIIFFLLSEGGPKQEKSFATDISGVLFAGERLLTFLAGLETFLNAKTKGLDRKNLDLR